MRVKPVIPLALLFVFGVVGPAFASSCGAGAVPPEGDIVARVAFEMYHFYLHLGMTFDAAIAFFTLSPEASGALLQLATDPLCTALTPTAAIFFVNPTMALVTLALTALLCLALLYVLYRAAERAIFRNSFAVPVAA